MSLIENLREVIENDIEESPSDITYKIIEKIDSEGLELIGNGWLGDDVNNIDEKNEIINSDFGISILKIIELEMDLDKAILVLIYLDNEGLSCNEWLDDESEEDQYLFFSSEYREVIEEIL